MKYLYSKNTVIQQFQENVHLSTKEKRVYMVLIPSYTFSTVEKIQQIENIC